MSCTHEMQDEFFRLARDTISKEMQELGRALQCDVKQEMQMFFKGHPLLNVPEDTLCGIPLADTELRSGVHPLIVPEGNHGMMSPPPGEAPTMQVEEMDAKDSSGKCCLQSPSDSLPNELPGGNGATSKSAYKLRMCADPETTLDEAVDSPLHKANSGQFVADAIPPLLPGAPDESVVKTVPKPQSPEKQVAFRPQRQGMLAPEPTAPEPMLPMMGLSTQPTSESRSRSSFSSARPSFAAQGSISPFDSMNKAWTIDKTQFGQKHVHAKAGRCTHRHPEGLQDMGVYSEWKRGRISVGVAFHKFVRGEWFDYLMGTFLALNAIVIGTQVDAMSRRSDDTVPVGFRIVDMIFCIIFTSEVVLRLWVVGHGEYLCGDQWRWNIFDVVVVSFQIVDELIKLFMDGTSVKDTFDSMGVIRMMRLAKLIRLVRMVRLVPELKSIVYLISASMHAFIWTFFLLFVMVYCVAVYYTEVAIDMSRDADAPPETRATIEQNFGTVAQSILSLFQAISGGDDWRNFVDPFVHYGKGSHMMNTLIFSIYISFASLVMLNLVTGVFVEGAQRLIQEEKEEKLIQEVRKLFSLSDVDLSGTLTFEEFASHMDTPAFEAFLMNVELENIQAGSLFRLMDRDGSGMLDVNEFVQGCMRLRGPSKSVDLSALRHDFEQLMSTWSSNLDTLSLNVGHIGNLVEHLHNESQHSSEALTMSRSQSREGPHGGPDTPPTYTRSINSHPNSSLEENVRLILQTVQRLVPVVSTPLMKETKYGAETLV